MSPDPLVLTTRKRRCRRCRELTWWAPASQLSSGTGLCLTHAGEHPIPDDTADLRTALATLYATFPQMTADMAPQKPAAARTTVTGTWLMAGIRWTRQIASHTRKDTTT